MISIEDIAHDYQELCRKGKREGVIKTSEIDIEIMKSSEFSIGELEKLYDYFDENNVEVIEDSVDLTDPLKDLLPTNL